MLSATTVQVLERLAQRSDAFYPEGGTVWTFTEAANQSHAKFPKQFATISPGSFSESDRNLLALVICRAMGSFLASEPDAEAFATADELVAFLRRDLQFSQAGVVSDDNNDYLWDATVHMARKADNRYFALQLTGSID